ncbi:hypothetical protein R5R35_009239 [Gryllus longicercus]|uniref:Protein KTI12 homolog n=1 Tax=Gryllus longicercus TaxID=2509291 RepID=A0AAN9Z2X5_9ORTH
MPLIIMCGPPSAGKTIRSLELKEYFEGVLKKNVHIVCENDLISASNITKNEVFNDSSKEKSIRGQIKSEATRLVGKEDVVVLDSQNYIKGYRYELYCMTKASKTTQCTILCCAPQETAWKWNLKREKNEQYSEEVFNALYLRFEEPDSRNRWDTPLFVVNPGDDLPLSDVSSALFERKPPPPNQSTQCPPLASANYLYEMDRITQEIVSAILAAQKMNIEGEVKVPGYSQSVVLNAGTRVTSAQLARIRRQFLSYTKLHPGTDLSRIGMLFIQYLNTNLV